MQTYKKIGILAGFVILCLNSCKQAGPQTDYPFKPVPFTEVNITDNFWLPRLETNRKITIPYALQQCEETGRVDNFEIAGGLKEGTFCSVYPFDDSDVFKIIEGASYSLRLSPDPELDKYLDELIAKIAAAQEEDGYLYTARTINADPPVRWVEKERWSNLYLGHELYNAGHLYEAAAAHFQATGKRSLLSIALKNADLIVSVFGPGKKHGAPGHQEIEIGLVKLYRITGNRKYLDLAKFFLDERGHPIERELFGEYSQDHKPVLEQTEAVGHAVRAVYMYSGMADVAALTGDTAYIEAIGRIWENVVSRKLYLTGGIGATGSGEAFAKDYDLPNATAYAETCAAIGNGLWNHRMFLLHGDAKYIDILERLLYNGLISGAGLSGDLFFYSNPLESYGQHQRSPWFTCACCPSNISRFMPSIPGYIYATRDNNLYVNLFIVSNAKIESGNLSLGIKQETNYPWEGVVKLSVEPAQAADFSINIRIPGWARNQPVPSDLYNNITQIEENVILKVNNELVSLNLEKGFARIQRHWKAGDTIELSLPMEIRRVESHPGVKENTGKVALERGPIVYCAEWPDNQGHISNLVLPDDVELTTEHRVDLFDGVNVIKGRVPALFASRNGASPIRILQEFMAIPYYAWAHRGQGEMAVWLPRNENNVRSLPQPTLASQSRVIASGEKSGVGLNDQWVPQSSKDQSRSYLHWWPSKGTQEWARYEFQKSEIVSAVEVYWFDDTGLGECRVPESWKILYKQGSDWIPVSTAVAYGISKDTYNRVTFKPVKTSGLRLNIQLQKDFSAGVLEWRVF